METEEITDEEKLITDISIPKISDEKQNSYQSKGYAKLFRLLIKEKDRCAKQVEKKCFSRWKKISSEGISYRKKIKIRFSVSCDKKKDSKSEDKQVHYCNTEENQESKNLYKKNTEKKLNNEKKRSIMSLMNKELNEKILNICWQNKDILNKTEKTKYGKKLNPYFNINLNKNKIKNNFLITDKYKDINNIYIYEDYKKPIKTEVKYDTKKIEKNEKIKNLKIYHDDKFKNIKNAINYSQSSIDSKRLYYKKLNKENKLTTIPVEKKTEKKINIKIENTYNVEKNIKKNRIKSLLNIDPSKISLNQKINKEFIYRKVVPDMLNSNTEITITHKRNNSVYETSTRECIYKLSSLEYSNKTIDKNILKKGITTVVQHYRGRKQRLDNFELSKKTNNK